MRIVKFLNRSSTEIQAKFSRELVDTLSVHNVRIHSAIESIPDLQVLAIEVDRDVLTVRTTPQHPLVLYTAEFISTAEADFVAMDGEPLIESGDLNKFIFVGLEDNNSVRDRMLDVLPDNYDTDSATPVRNYISILAEVLRGLQRDILEVGNANYISILVEDEIKRRGYSATDRLDNESAYEVVRISRSPGGDFRRGSLEFNTDSGYGNDAANRVRDELYTLKEVRVDEEVVSNTEQELNSFFETTVSLSKPNLIRINSIRLITGLGDEYIYDIPAYKYLIADNRFDLGSAARLVTLGSNQFKLSESAILSGDFPAPQPSDRIIVSYSYMDEGLSVKIESVELTKLQSVMREPVFAIQNVFFLKNAGIVSAQDRVVSIGGVQFLDPAPTSGAAPFTTIHPAFKKEIIFNQSRLPAAPGEYSVNYQTGQVFVYGAASRDGTGNVPPVATYHYRKRFTENIDYVIDRETLEFRALSSGRLLGETDITVRYDFEHILTPGVDYLPKTHIEVIGEEVQSRFFAPNRISTLKHPITNVFEVHNSTTGEQYDVLRYNDSNIYLAGSQLPRVETINSENANFERITAEKLYITEVLSQTVDEKIVRIELHGSNIVSLDGKYLADPTNTSLVLTGAMFQSEYYYDDALQDLVTNLLKLSDAGDYLVDYVRGYIYAVLDIGVEDVAEASYTHNLHITARPRVNAVLSAGYKTFPTEDYSHAIQPFISSNTSIRAQGLLPSGERFLYGNTQLPIIIGLVDHGVSGQRSPGSSTFTALDGRFDESYADGYHYVRFPDDSDRLITGFISGISVTVDMPFTDSNREIQWMVYTTDQADGYSVSVTNDIYAVRGVYTISELQTLPVGDLTNYYVSGTDLVSERRIVLRNAIAAALVPGEAVIIQYDLGPLLFSYSAVTDDIRVSYEYGDNELDFSISNTLRFDDEYFVTYRYGALRDALLANFGVLTQIENLTNFPIDFNRELYRDLLLGTLQAFINGSTNQSIADLVDQVTKVPPNIRELDFNEWTLDRDNLFLAPPRITGDIEYAPAGRDIGAYFGKGVTMSYPTESYISLREGTASLSIAPDWRGLDDDAELTLEVYTPDGYDGYTITDGHSIALSDIYIGASAYNPEDYTFTLSRFLDGEESVLGMPENYSDGYGYFIWYDNIDSRWRFRWRGIVGTAVEFKVKITTTGNFYNITDGYDGYTILNESTDLITSTSKNITIYSTPDGYDGADGDRSEDGIDFNSDNIHYLFDVGEEEHSNRISLFKDSSGYLVYRVYDRTFAHSGVVKMYTLSHNIQDWVAGEQHDVGISWRFNSPDSIDEMHLFVDSLEVLNNWKYGAKPAASYGSDIYRTEAIEAIATNVAKSIVNRGDGITTNGSPILTSASAEFITNSVAPGDQLHILDLTADGAANPYTVNTVISETQVELDQNFTLSLTDVNFTVNRLEIAVESDIDIERFIVTRTDTDGETFELRGLDADVPDYSVERELAQNTIIINSGVQAGDDLNINTLGLRRGRTIDYVYKYTASNKLKTNLRPPQSLRNIDINKYIINRIALADGATSFLCDGYVTVTGTSATGEFTNITELTNVDVGKTIAVTLHGNDNIDFFATNEVTIDGYEFDGASIVPATEVLTINNYGSVVSTKQFTSITSIGIEFTALDSNRQFGAIEIFESIPMTRPEAGGNYADTLSYSNGVFQFTTFGSGGLPFDVTPGYYRIQYPTALNIRLETTGRLHLGTDLNGENPLRGYIDEVHILNEMLLDNRPGDPVSDGEKSITKYHNSPRSADETPQTTMLLKFNQDSANSARVYKTYDKQYITSGRSVNDNFGDSLVADGNSLLALQNSDAVIRQNTGTIEFWVSPMIDTRDDMLHRRYYIDITSFQTEITTSISANTIILKSKAKNINLIRLIDDIYGDTDYADGAKLALDGKTITLLRSLPANNTQLVVSFTPVDADGDRISIYKDGYGYLNYEIRTSLTTSLISTPINWQRNTWHRVKATYSLNNNDNRDRMRMWVDGIEGGVIKWGTPGFLYGIGILYGSAGVSNTSLITTNIDLTDVLSDIYIGNSYDDVGRGMCRMDNIRFSYTERPGQIIAGQNIDINYQSNTEVALPVIEDVFTTMLLNFDKNPIETERLSNLVPASAHLFNFDVSINDAFNRVEDVRARSVLSDVLRRIKPAHTGIKIDYLSGSRA